MEIKTPYEFLKECFDEIKNTDPLNRKAILQGYAAHMESRERTNTLRAIDSCIKATQRTNNIPQAVTEMSALYGYAKVGVQK